MFELLKEKHKELLKWEYLREKFAERSALAAFCLSVFLLWYFQWGKVIAVITATVIAVFVYLSVVKALEK